MDKRLGQPPSSPPSTSARALSREKQRALLPFLLLSLAALWLERGLRAFWRLWLLLGAFLTVALWGWLPTLPPLWHTLILALLALAAANFIRKGLRQFRPPTLAAAKRRLEKESGLRHRPLDVIEDSLALRPAAGPLVKLWRCHQAWAHAQLQWLKPVVPRPVLSDRDPLSLRFLLALLLFLSAAANAGHWPERLAGALVPALTLPRLGTPPTLMASIEPPAWSGLPQRVLELTTANTNTKPIDTPEDSVLSLKVQHAWLPRLTVNGKPIALNTAPDKDEASIRLPLTGETNDIHLQSFLTSLLDLHINTVRNAPPQITLKESPSITTRQSLRLNWQAEDDFGLAEISLVITPLPPRATQENAPSPNTPSALTLPPETIALPLPKDSAKKTEQINFLDLTPSTFAGMEVSLSLTARDRAGLEAATTPISLTLPKRDFRHPLAKAIIAARERLIQEGNAARQTVASILATIAMAPLQYGQDPLVLLSLRAAAVRLILDRDKDAVRGTLDLLWQVALRLEDGGISYAEDQWRRAQAAVNAALNEGGDRAALRAALDQLQQAFFNFLQAMAARGGGAAPQDALLARLLPEQPVIADTELMAMLMHIRALAETGNTAAAQKMLAEMQELMENLQTAAPKGGATLNENHPVVQALRAITAVIEDQKKLMDETFRQARENDEAAEKEGTESGKSTTNQTLALAPEQKRLRESLAAIDARLQKQMGSAPAELNTARLAMQKAEERLAKAERRESLKDQGAALEALQSLLQQAAEEMRKRLAAMPGAAQGSGGSGGRDPFGRLAGGQEGEEPAVPNAAEASRARAILEDIRARADDYRRPRDERDYLQRLLDSF